MTARCPHDDVGPAVGCESGRGFQLRSGANYARKKIMSAPISPFLNLAAVIRGLRGSVGGWGLPGWLNAALVLVLHRRLGQIGVQMERMAARFAAGKLRRRQPVATRAPRRAMGGGGRRGDDGLGLWPRSFGWLVKAAGWRAAGFGSQLRAVLETPEMVALLEASPQAGRVLRPLCRMLAIETQLLRLPPVRKGDAAVVETPPRRIRTSRAKVEGVPCSVRPGVPVVHAVPLGRWPGV
jgi:hypothetical protein